MQAAAEDRLHPIADLSKIDAYKQYFLRCAKAICPGYIVRDDQRNILNDIVHWALKDYDGNLTRTGDCCFGATSAPVNQRFCA